MEVQPFRNLLLLGLVISMSACESKDNLESNNTVVNNSEIDQGSNTIANDSELNKGSIKMADNKRYAQLL